MRKKLRTENYLKQWKIRIERCRDSGVEYNETKRVTPKIHIFSSHNPNYWHKWSNTISVNVLDFTEEHDVLTFVFDD